MLGTKNGSDVSRHETFARVPTLHTALAYEAILNLPVRELFAGEYTKVEAQVRRRAEDLAHRILVPGAQGARKREVFARLLGW